MRKTTFLIGAVTGYVLGAKAGRGRYEQICAVTGKVTRNPKVQQAAGSIAARGNEMAHDLADKAAQKAPDWVPGSRSVADANPMTVGVNGRRTTS